MVCNLYTYWNERLVPNVLELSGGDIIFSFHDSTLYIIFVSLLNINSCCNTFDVDFGHINIKQRVYSGTVYLPTFS